MRRRWCFRTGYQSIASGVRLNVVILNMSVDWHCCLLLLVMLRSGMDGKKLGGMNATFVQDDGTSY